ncbi:hypothetical protein KQI88_10355 [Alkaliphilus sp. MSJ-5]|uniref:HNH endonuclease n=1 Tax=Alkaliphilus flagellatus TaxID=2841507 RepID=A0ABS6G2V6_9FIRM|nr:hypothetical protein [Alkaliphilus flagellatus]MBU5676820.1 hypothetical protein [Alkaliphilus flagellatus]
MICAYCKEDKNSSKEHIISDSVLELFPECDLTIDSVRNRQYKADPVIKDVCSNCNNNRLSYIDGYAKHMISQYFAKAYEQDDTLEFEYEYDKLLKVLMKFTYNDLRSHKNDISFFDKGVLEFLLNKEKKDIGKHVTVLGGLWVNTSPMPEYIFGNLKLRWVNGSIFLDNSMIKNVDYHTGRVFYREENKQVVLKGLTMSYFFRFNSGLFVILFWDSEETRYDNEKFLQLSYPYTLIDPTSNSVILERCTHAYNCHQPHLIDVSWGIGMADATNGMVSTDINPIDIQKTLNEEWEKHEQEVRIKHKKE